MVRAVSANRKQKAPKPLASLYSEPKDETAKALIGTPDRHREQETYTPEIINTLCEVMWGEIALDPCWGPGSIVQSQAHYYVPKRLILDAKGDVVESYEAAPNDQNGLELPWLDRTYFNPPYKWLKAWLEKAISESDKGFEIIGLVPTRGHRTWFRAATRSATRVADLDPLCFCGHKSAFPAPLCLLYWGQMPRLFEYWIEELKLGECR